MVTLSKSLQAERVTREWSRPREVKAGLRALIKPAQDDKRKVHITQESIDALLDEWTLPQFSIWDHCRKRRTLSGPVSDALTDVWKRLQLDCIEARRQVATGQETDLAQQAIFDMMVANLLVRSLSKPRLDEPLHRLTTIAQILC